MRPLPVALLAAGLACPGFVLTGLAPAAYAQLMLPGAVGAPPPGEGGGAESRPADRKPIVLKPPGEESVAGRSLLRQGSSGAISLERSGTQLSVARLSFAGDRMSVPGERCRVDIEGAPLATRFLGRPAGLSRYAVALPACPFSFDVLDGAVLIGKEQAACEFAAADCRVDMAGLWGPPAASFDAAKIRDMEHARLQAETTMRANFRVLIAHAGKNHAAVKAIAAEQAAFSSQREELCRDYAGEAVNGFCALQITEARNHALLAKLGAATPHGTAAAPPAARPKKPAPTAAVRPPPDTATP